MQENWHIYLPRSTFSSRSVLNEIVERNLMGEHYMKVEEYGEPITYQLSIDVYITKKRQARGFKTALDTPYEHDYTLKKEMIKLPWCVS